MATIHMLFIVWHGTSKTTFQSTWIYQVKVGQVLPKILNTLVHVHVGQRSSTQRLTNTPLTQTGRSAQFPLNDRTYLCCVAIPQAKVIKQWSCTCTHKEVQFRDRGRRPTLTLWMRSNAMCVHVHTHVRVCMTIWCRHVNIERGKTHQPTR